MRLGAYIFLMFSISLILYYMGYTSPMLTVYNNQGNGSLVILCTAPGCTNGLLNQLIDSIINPTGALTVIGLVVAVALITGFSAMYLIPLLLLVVILNLFVFPISFLFIPGTMPDVIAIPIVILFNLLTIMAITNFIRGGSV